MSAIVTEAALHMLHEQAHGDVPWSTCMAEPCKSLRIDGVTAAGPAPATLPTAGRTR